VTLSRGARSAGMALISAALVVLVFTVFADRPLVRGMETASLDLRFRLRGVRPPGSEVTAILVDDRSLEAFGRWPFSRALFARALEVLDHAGAKVVAFDLLFTEPDEPVPADLREAARAAAEALAGSRSDGLRAALEQLADNHRDSRFAAAIRASGHVLLPIGLSFVDTPGEEPSWLSQSAYARFDKSPLPPVFPLRPKSAILPIETLAAAAAGLGHTSVAFDRDGAPRYDYVALPFEADFLPSLSIRIAAAYLGVAWSQVALALGAGVRIGDLTVPTDEAMRLLINYRGPRDTFPSFSFADLMAGRVATDKIAGRIVLIGASFAGSGDSFTQPFGNTPMPGVERMANIIDTIISRDFIGTSSESWNIVVIAAILLAAVLAGAVTEFLPTRFAALAGAAPIAAWTGAAQLAFAKNLWLPLVEPVAALATAAATVLLFRYWVADRDGRVIRSAFRHYLAPEMVAVLAAHPEQLQLGGETRPMTIMFCDVRGFTAISEEFKSNPHALTKLINRLLTPMSDIIMGCRGTIDKYMGDCIMAFWNAPLDDPDHAHDACAAALVMLDELERLNRDLAAEAAGEGRPFQRLDVGIGINTGDCVVGNMGSTRRFDYTVLGDAVNLASRLESQSKNYGVGIVLGEATRAAALDWAAIELDRITVKGKTEPVAVYALLGNHDYARSPQFAALVERHRRMLACYRAQDWARARAAIGECRRYDARLAQLYDLYDERIGLFAVSSPGPDWDGVFVATEK
jgi:adenylate cyclase